MRKKWVALFMIFSFLFASTPQEGLTYLIAHQEDFKFKKLAFTDKGIEVEIPADTLAKIYGRKGEIGYSRAEAVPEEKDIWKVTMSFPPKKEEKPVVKKELPAPESTPSLSKEEKAAVESLRKEREKSEKKAVKPGPRPLFTEKPVLVKKEAPEVKPSQKPLLNRPVLSSVQPVVKIKKKKEKKLSGKYSAFSRKIQNILLEPVDITLKGVPPLAFFDFLSEKTGLTIVPVGEIPLNHIDLFIKKTPLYKVAEIVLAQTGLSLLPENENVAIIGTISEIKRLRENKIILSQLDMSLPAVRIIRVKNTKVDTLAGDIKRIYGNFLKVIALKESKILVLKGASSAVEQAEEIVRKIDKPKAQILVQAKVVEVSESEIKNLGIRWVVEGVSPAGANGLPVTLKTSPGLGQAPPTNTVDSVRALNENPVFGQVLKLGIPHGIASFEAALSGLIQKGKAKVLSEPYVTVEEGEEGKMEQVKEIPYSFVNNWLANVSFRNAGLILHVTPYIVDAKKSLIKLKVKVESSAPDFSREVGGLPPIDRQGVEVVNVIRDGEYRILGGLKIKKVTKNKKGIPILSSIPILKDLFSSKNNRKDTYELLIVIRPKIQEI